MGDPIEERKIQEFAPMEKSKSKLSCLWCVGLNSLRNLAFTSILVCVMLLSLPSLVVLSVLEAVFSVPFGFIFAIYPAVNELMSILLGEPRPPIPFCSVYEDECSDDLGKEYGKYEEEKVKEEGYEQDYDREEEEKELEDDTRRALEARIELGEEDHTHRKIQEEGELGTAPIHGQLGINEASKDFEEGTGDKVNEIGHEGVKEYSKQTDYTEENDIDIELVREKDAFRLGMRTKDTGTTTVEFDNVERENVKKEKKRVVTRGDEKQDEAKNVVPWTQMTSPFLSWGSSGDFGNLEQLLSPSEKDNGDELQEDSGAVEGQFHKIEPGELVRETMEMVEAVRNEGKAEIENIQQSMEEATSILPAVSGPVNGAVLDLERLKLLSIESSIDDVPRLQTINEQLETDKPKKKDDGLASLQVEIEHTTNTTMKVFPQKEEQMKPVGDIWNATYKSMYEAKSEGIGAENHTFGMKIDRGESTTRQCEKKPVAHLKKLGDHSATDIREETYSSIPSEELKMIEKLQF